jgi:hypothetical protein
MKKAIYFFILLSALISIIPLAAYAGPPPTPRHISDTHRLMDSPWGGTRSIAPYVTPLRPSEGASLSSDAVNALPDSGVVKESKSLAGDIVKCSKWLLFLNCML